MSAAICCRYGGVRAALRPPEIPPCCDGVIDGVYDRLGFDVVAERVSRNL